MSLVVKKDYPAGYPDDALSIIRAMSFADGKNVHIVGSMSLRSQIYAGDYDAYEIVKTHGNRDLALKDIIRKFKHIVRTVSSLPNTYIADIKSGSVEEWVIIHKPYNYTQSKFQLEKLHREKIISDELFREGTRRIKEHPSKLELLALERDFRPNVIRWSVSEIYAGSKKLIDGRRFTLYDAFQSPIITKLDVVSWVQNNRFTDFSMIYQFQNNGKDLNPGMSEIEPSLRENIFMLHHEGNYFKMAKRMFALAKYKKYNSMLEKLSPLFNGDVGRLYIVYGDIGTLESLIETHGIVSPSKIDFEIDQFKGRLSNIRLEKYISHEHEIFELIDRIVDARKLTREQMLEILKKLKTILSNLMSGYAKQYLLETRLMPTY
uniref:Uncharacterized protein n=1 Tax=viral metagenome TaxID=1070528 RepID=A0A6C0JNJ9_9ZZZZ